jgi:hypothetical protein
MPDRWLDSPWRDKYSGTEEHLHGQWIEFVLPVLATRTRAGTQRLERERRPRGHLHPNPPHQTTAYGRRRRVRAGAVTGCGLGAPGDRLDCCAAYLRVQRR